MLNFTADQPVVIDESLFKEQTGWRPMAYAPIGERARWHDNITRGKTHSLLAAYTVDGYLPDYGLFIFLLPPFFLPVHLFLSAITDLITLGIREGSTI